MSSQGSAFAPVSRYRREPPPCEAALRPSRGLSCQSKLKLQNSLVFSSTSRRSAVARSMLHTSCHFLSRSLRPTNRIPGRSGDSRNSRALTPVGGVRSRTTPLTRSTVEMRQFSSPFSSCMNRICRPSQDQSCQTIGRSLRRVSGSAVATVTDRRKPQVEHALQWCEPRQPRAIRTKSGLEAARVAEQPGARDQRDFRHSDGSSFPR
jgi:hypothetical protein